MVVLLARLHLIGFLWGDVSLSNTLFRRDAGAFAAYLVDAETGELHDELSDGQREHDLTIARTNLFGEFCDLEAGGLLDASLDPLQLVEAIENRYRELWGELTGVEEFDGSEMHRIESRVRRLNALGFDVAELDITTDFAGSTIRIQPKVVDAGHHSRRLLRLTGLDTEENQARRLLNDLDYYRARTDQQNADEAIVAHQWLTERFEPVVNSVPHEMRGKLEPAELYHEVLEHRWFLSERAGRRSTRYDAAQSYMDSVLHRLPDEAVAVSTRRPWSAWPTRSIRRWASPTAPTTSRTTPGKTTTRVPAGTRSRPPPISTSPPCGPGRASRRYATDRSRMAAPMRRRSTPRTPPAPSTGPGRSRPTRCSRSRSGPSPRPGPVSGRSRRARPPGRTPSRSSAAGRR